MLFLRLCLLLLVIPCAYGQGSETFVYRQSQVEEYMRNTLPSSTYHAVGIALDDTSTIRKLHQDHPSHKGEIDYALRQDAAAFHSRARNGHSANQTTCYVLFRKTSGAHARIKRATGLSDEKVAQIVVAHEANHCVVHKAMTTAYAKLRENGSNDYLKWFPPTLHSVLKSQSSGLYTVRKNDLANAGFQQWTESLADLFAMNDLWLRDEITTSEIAAYIQFRTDDAGRDPEHATAVSLRKLKTLLQAIERTPQAERAYRALPKGRQHLILAELLSDKA